ncbi:IgE-binding protein [Coccidioides immitis RS]|uniref:IgE-binding protein n=1 Tax=Coccidioides immitis (strain RS) TaxID=246410 RepID=A0A0E1RZZ7_COCIM|nr:IgE-binding protein [Coccidioides immitis RS]EAS27503.1 IgE-binding protein [Coccidioides immitis RS]
MKLTILAVILPLLAAAAPGLEARQSEPPYLPKIKVMASRSGSPIHSLPMNAAGRAFWLGGTTQSYCPIQVGDNCPPGNETVIAGLSSMYVLVPGGQQMYVEPSGAVGFTQAHSTYIPPGSYIGGFTYEPRGEHGIYSFTGWGADGFMGCPDPEVGFHQVYANIQNASVPTGDIKDCLPFVALAITYPGNNPAAWQYV